MKLNKVRSLNFVPKILFMFCSLVLGAFRCLEYRGILNAIQLRLEKRVLEAHKRLVVLLFGIILPFLCSSAKTFVSEPFGQIKLTVNGTNGAGSSAVTVLGAPLENEIEAATWTPGVFAATHYVQITSGTYTGVSATIVGNTATELITSEDLSPLLNGGESFVVRAYTTLADVFGAFNEAGLGSGPNAGVADVVLIYNRTLLKIIKLSS